jgi:hypothetical protein
MRTKTLLLSAAVGAAGLLAADAQVYSVNSVGYVNKTLANAGFHMISNPLRAADNNLNTVIPNAPEGSVLYLFRNGAYSDTAEYFEGVGWFPDDLTIGDGEGAFIRVPEPTTLTFVGEVRQGNLSTQIPQGFSIRASQVPQEAALSVLGLPGGDGDVVYTFDSVAQQYGESAEYFEGVGWFPDLTIGVAESVFVRAEANRTWSRTFSVNN